tara:strand:- start:263 stop:499 length:237 start_codon:yes stop_codon:yes gene_type:complete
VVEKGEKMERFLYIDNYGEEAVLILDFASRNRMEWEEAMRLSSFFIQKQLLQQNEVSMAQSSLDGNDIYFSLVFLLIF